MKYTILSANVFQSSNSTFSRGSLPAFFAFKEGMWVTRLSALGGSPTVSRPVNETLGRVLFQRRKPPSGVSFSHLNKHRLINSLEEYIDEPGLCRENTQTGLPLEISPKVPESAIRCW